MTKNFSAAEAMKKAQKKKEEWQQQGHGEYSEIPEEKEFFNVTKNSENVVCHFYREETFRQCCVFPKLVLFYDAGVLADFCVQMRTLVFLFLDHTGTQCAVSCSICFLLFCWCISKRCSGSVTFWYRCGWGS